jgi:hypothetical protein
MLSPSQALKALLLVPAVILIFYGVIYFVLAELNVQPKLNKFYRSASLVLSGGGALLLAIFFMI